MTYEAKQNKTKYEHPVIPMVNDGPACMGNFGRHLEVMELLKPHNVRNVNFSEELEMAYYRTNGPLLYTGCATRM